MHVRLKNHRVYLHGANGLVLTMSEQYATHWNAKRAAKRMFPDLPRTDENGEMF